MASRRQVSPTPAKRERQVWEDSKYHYEGLDKHEWRDAEYKPPSVAVAKANGKGNRFMRGDGRICGPSSALDVLGVGLGLYFRLTKYLGCLFFLMTLFALPTVIICRTGSRIEEEDVDPLTLNLFSLANIGSIPDPACDSPDTYHLVEDLASCNSTTIEILGREVEETDISLLIAMCDFFYSLIFFFFIYYFKKRIATVNYNVDSTHVNIADYSVFVKGLPRDASAQEIREHFNNLYDLSKPDWTFEGFCCGCVNSKTTSRKTHDHQLRENMDRVQRFFRQKVDDHQAAMVENAPVKDISNSLNPDYLGSWVAEVVIAHPNGGLIRKYRAQQDRLDLIRQMKATILRHKQGAKEFDPKKLNKAEKKLRKLETAQEKFDLKHAMKLKTETVGAFVVFNCEDSRSYCVDDYANAKNCCGKRYMAPPLLFRKEHPLEVAPATEPSDIIWENIETTDSQRRKRQCCVYSIMLFLLLISVVIMAIAQNKKVEFQQGVPNLDVCSLELPALAFGGYGLVPTDPVLQHVADLDASCQAQVPPQEFFITYEGYAHNVSRNWRCNIPDSADPQCVDADSSITCQAISGEVFTRSSLVGCFCIQELNRLIDEKGIFSGARALIDDEGDACIDFALNYSLANILLLIAASMVVFTNTLLKVILRRVTRFERHDTNTAMERAISIKVFFAQFINTGLVVLIVNAKLSSGLPDEVGIGAGEFTSFEPRWYAVVGTSILVTMVINVIAPHLLPLLHMTVGACKRTRSVKRRAVTQAQLDALYEPRVFLLSTRYPVVLNTMFVCLVYASGLPILVPLAFLAFFFTYWVDKCTLLRLYGKPPQMGPDLAKFSQKLLPWALFFHLGFSVWMYGDSDTLVSKPVDFGNKEWEERYNEYINGEGSKFDEIDLVPKLLRQNVFPMAFLLFCLIFSKTLWKFLGRPIKNFVILILYVFLCCWACKRKSSRVKHHHPRFTAPYVERLEPMDKTVLTKKERAEGWRIVDDPTRPAKNGLKHRAKVKVWLETGVHRRVRHQAGQTKLTWQVVEESYVPTYQIIAQPKYRALYTTLLDAREKVQNAAQLTLQTQSPFAPEQYRQAPAVAMPVSTQEIPVFQGDWNSAMPSAGEQKQTHFANPAMGHHFDPYAHPGAGHQYEQPPHLQQPQQPQQQQYAYSQPTHQYPQGQYHPQPQQPSTPQQHQQYAPQQQYPQQPPVAPYSHPETPPAHQPYSAAPDHSTMPGYNPSPAPAQPLHSHSASGSGVGFTGGSEIVGSSYLTESEPAAATPPMGAPVDVLHESVLHESSPPGTPDIV